MSQETLALKFCILKITETRVSFQQLPSYLFHFPFLNLIAFFPNNSQTNLKIDRHKAMHNLRQHDFSTTSIIKHQAHKPFHITQVRSNECRNNHTYDKENTTIRQKYTQLLNFYFYCQIIKNQAFFQNRKLLRF